MRYFGLVCVLFVLAVFVPIQGTSAQQAVPSPITSDDGDADAMSGVMPDFEEDTVAFDQPAVAVEVIEQSLPADEAAEIEAELISESIQQQAEAEAVGTQDGSATTEHAQPIASGEPPTAENEDPHKALTQIIAVRTESPRRTIETMQLVAVSLEAALEHYRREKSPAALAMLTARIEQFLALMDLSTLPVSSRYELGTETMTALLDIFNRIPLPHLEEVPDLDELAETPIEQWRIPDTPLRIHMIEEGSRSGEFLFTERTVIAAPRFYQSIESLPLVDEERTISWTRIWPQLTGPMVPAFIGRAMPSSLRTSVLDTPIWKIIMVFALTAASGLAVYALNVALRRVPRREGLRIAMRVVAPLSLVVLATVLDWFFLEQINLTGAFANMERAAATVVLALALAWAGWTIANAVSDAFILSPKVKQGSFNESLLRLAGRTVGAIAVLLSLVAGGYAIGLPVFSVLAGLGIGGLAVALAIRPTLENMIAGFILFVDKPVRVGDFCSFGEFSGTVENIGLRSTKIRMMDRTLITTPNAKFADMEIVNYARADMMMIHEFIGLRYETKADQLRFVLARFREMFHAHPRIDGDTIRVRFRRFADSALEIEVRVYALTREWNDFFAIREDVLMRMFSIVEEAGTGFAFPSQTVYFARDHGLDEGETKAAERTVANWRRSRSLPFPRLGAARIAALKDTLDYPPRGSVETRTAGGDTAEPLSEPEPLSDPEPLAARDDETENPTEERDAKSKKSKEPAS